MAYVSQRSTHDVLQDPESESSGEEESYPETESDAEESPVDGSEESSPETEHEPEESPEESPEEESHDMVRVRRPAIVISVQNKMNLIFKF